MYQPPAANKGMRAETRGAPQRPAARLPALPHSFPTPRSFLPAQALLCPRGCSPAGPPLPCSQQTTSLQPLRHGHRPMGGFSHGAVMLGCSCRARASGGYHDCRQAMEGVGHLGADTMPRCLWHSLPPHVTVHVVREQEGVRGIRAHLLQQLLGHCKESTRRASPPCSSPAALCLPRVLRAPASVARGGHSGGSASGPRAPSPAGGSHRRCRRLAVVSSCRGGTGPRRWPGQQPRCSSPCGGTSWRPSAGHPEPSTLQRAGAWTRGQTCLTLPARHQPRAQVQPDGILVPCSLHGPWPRFWLELFGVPIWGPSVFRASHSGLPRRNRP